MVTDRWKALGLHRLQPGQDQEVSTADLLFHALAPEKAQDPVEGMIVGVREDLEALAVLADDVLGTSLNRLARRLEVAVALLRQADGRPISAKSEGAANDVTATGGAT